MSKPVNRNAVRLVSQWCQAVEEIVNLHVKGSVFGDLINGRVIECTRATCHAQNTPYCWLQRRIMTSIK